MEITTEISNKRIVFKADDERSIVSHYNDLGLYIYNVLRNSSILDAGFSVVFGEWYQINKYMGLNGYGKAYELEEGDFQPYPGIVYHHAFDRNKEGNLILFVGYHSSMSNERFNCQYR